MKLDNITLYDSEGNLLKTLYQWDTNISIRIENVDTTTTPMIHFSNCANGIAYVVNVTAAGNGRVVTKIPNILLQQPESIIVYMYYTINDETNEQKTKYVFRIPVVPRQKPHDYEYEENIDYVNWVELSQDADAAATAANQAAYSATLAAQSANNAAAAAQAVADDWQTAIAAKADKNNTELTGSLSLGRKSETMVGTNSVALGGTVEASGVDSFAEGNLTKASGQSSHAEGLGTQAVANQQHVEGKWNIADTIDGSGEGTYAHIVGNGDIGTRSNAYTLDWNGNAWFAGQVRVGGLDGSYSGGSRLVSTSDSAFIGKANKDNAVFTGSISMGRVSETKGTKSVALGNDVSAAGAYSFAQGDSTGADADCAHAEGYATYAGGYAAHAEGYETSAEGSASHAEGIGTWASSNNQHAQGKYNIEDSSNTYAHIVGNGTAFNAPSNAHTLDWDGRAWFAKGVTANNNNAGVVRTGGLICGENLIREMTLSTATDNGVTFSWSGVVATVQGTASPSSANYTLFDNSSAFPAGITAGSTYHLIYESSNVSLTIQAYVSGTPQAVISQKKSIDFKIPANATGLVIKMTVAQDVQADETVSPIIYNIDADINGNGDAQFFGGVQVDSSLSMGRTGTAGAKSTALGTSVKASGSYSHAEGSSTEATGSCSHAEGYKAKASGSRSHAEGNETIASGTDSHAEGYKSQATKTYAHAEGYYTLASGSSSHAECGYSEATGNYSHAEGQYTLAASQCQHTQGKFNIRDSSGTYAHIVGNGTADNARSNAHTLDWSGNAWYAGDLRIGGTSYANAYSLKPNLYDPTSLIGTMRYVLTTSGTTHTLSFKLSNNAIIVDKTVGALHEISGASPSTETLTYDPVGASDRYMAVHYNTGTGAFAWTLLPNNSSMINTWAPSVRDGVFFIGFFDLDTGKFILYDGDYVQVPSVSDL